MWKACALLGTGFAFSATAAAQGAPQLTFSIDFSGPTIDRPGDPQGTPITDADLLVRAGGPFDPVTPQISLRGAFLEQYVACQGHVPGFNCGVEVNAISFGRDARLRLNPGYEFNVLFSVDEWSRGRPAAAGSPANVFDEAAGSEASTDIFLSSFTGVGPFSSPGNSAYADGDGERVQSGAPHVFGLGLTEPTPQSQTTTDLGDNVDAINYGREFDPAVSRLFFSLEGDLPRCNEGGQLVNSAANQSILGSLDPARSSDVLLWVPGSMDVAAYVRGTALGLDQLGPDRDDIDALMVLDNGDGVYTPPVDLYDWNTANGSDLILFSVRCGSDIVGQPDSDTGRLITEGDILIKLNNGSTNPQVFLPAEALGLRSSSAGAGESDELNGLDIFDGDEDPFLDCNLNGIDDALDISNMNSDDIDNNGIPDECEDDWSSYCDCALASDAPCGNNTSAGRGCENISSLGAKLGMVGTTSVDSDSFMLVANDMNPTGGAVLFGGLAAGNAFLGNGNICLGPGFVRLSGALPVTSGSVTAGPGLIGSNPGTLSSLTGSNFRFQFFYRDSGNTCGATVNSTNAIRVLFTP